MVDDGQPPIIYRLPVHHIEPAHLKLKNIQHAHFMHFSVCNMDVARDFCLYVQHRVLSDGYFVLPEFRPPENIQAQVDCGRINGINRVAIKGRKFFVGQKAFSGIRNQQVGKIGKYPPVPFFVRMRQV